MVLIVCCWILLVLGEGRAPELNITISARINELENIHFVRYIALPTVLLSDVAM